MNSRCRNYLYPSGFQLLQGDLQVSMQMTYLFAIAPDSSEIWQNDCFTPAPGANGYFLRCFFVPRSELPRSSDFRVFFIDVRG
jgi:hypothetical protein